MAAVLVQSWRSLLSHKSPVVVCCDCGSKQGDGRQIFTTQSNGRASVTVQ
jgi:hypothetical protein